MINKNSFRQWMVALMLSALSTADLNAQQNSSTKNEHSGQQSIVEKGDISQLASLSPDTVLVGSMVTIPAGKYRMGDLAGIGWPEELPAHFVSIRQFKLGKYLVTVSQWAQYLIDNPEANDGCGGEPDWPVTCISWNDVQGYVAWLNRKTGQHFRLPSEAEWEYAARAGTTTLYPWGNDFSSSHANNNHTGATNVGQFPANSFGLYDMIGNVWEWTQDCSNNHSYKNAPVDGSAWTDSNCHERIMRGGSWNVADSAIMRVSFRNSYFATANIIGVGFRLAQD